MEATHKMKTDENYPLCLHVVKRVIFLVQLTKLSFIPTFVVNFLFGIGLATQSEQNPVPVEVSDTSVTTLHEAEFHPSFFRLSAANRKVTPRSCNASKGNLLNVKKCQVYILSAQLLEEKLFGQNLLPENRAEVSALKVA